MKTFLKWAAIVAGGFVVLLIVVVALAGDDGPSGATSSAPVKAATPQQAAPSEPLIRVSAAELTAAYEENQFAADQEYLDRIGLVTGYVGGVDEAITDLYVTVKPTTEEFVLWDVTCYVPDNEANKAALATLRENDPIAVRGRIDGKALLTVTMTDCEIV